MNEEAQYQRVARILAERIDHGDYQLTPIPSVRKLAGEMQVSHIVARKAVEKLIVDGRCLRVENGRLSAIPGGARQKADASIAMLQPAFDSSYFMRCRQMLEREAARSGCFFRAVNYVHWNDPAIQEALNGFDGIFLLANTEPLDDPILKQFRQASGKLVSVDLDLTAAGIPRLALFDASCIAVLLEHLTALGHRHIDCLNTQPCDVETLRRIGVWQTGRDRREYSGELHNRPVAHYEDPVLAAYRLTAELLADAPWRPGALLCTNEATAYGVLRALHDGGVRCGEELSVCAVGDGGNARYFCPSISCIEMPDVSTQLAALLDWMKSPQRTWSGPLNLLPDRPALFHGESTRPAKTTCP